MNRPLVIWFLKSRSEEDKYSKLFEAHDYSVHFLPMLEFAFKNENKLEEIILHNYSRYGGIILTSPRAAEALDRCIQHIKKRINTDADTQLTDNLKIAAEYWQSHPLFAVGARTGSSCTAISFKNKIIGESDAIELCARIAQQGDFTQTLLFLCGNLRRDELPNTLKARNIAFEELVVYETHQAKDAPVVSTSSWLDNRPDWIVFFSPSGVESMLAQYFPAGHDFWKVVKIASIGQTTNQAIMRDTAFGRSADAVAQKPTPDALLEAITKAEANE